MDAAPAPSSPSAFELPSPQFDTVLWRVIIFEVVVGVLDIFKVNNTLSIDAPLSIFPAISNARRPRLIMPLAVLPTKKWAPFPLLRAPVSLSYSVLSLPACMITSVWAFALLMSANGNNANEIIKQITLKKLLL